MIRRTMFSQLLIAIPKLREEIWDNLIFFENRHFLPSHTKLFRYKFIRSVQLILKDSTCTHELILFQSFDREEKKKDVPVFPSDADLFGRPGICFSNFRCRLSFDGSLFSEDQAFFFGSTGRVYVPCFSLFVSCCETRRNKWCEFFA